MSEYHCPTCQQWVDDSVLEAVDPDTGEVIKTCGYCGSEVNTYSEDQSGWEYHPPY